MFELKGQWHKYYALVLLVFVISVVFVYVVNPILQAANETQQNYETLVEQWQRYQSISSKAELVQQQNEQLLLQLKDNRDFIRAESLNAAENILQKRVMSIAQNHGADVGRVEVLKVNSEKKDNVVSLQVQLVTSHKKLLPLLYQIENSQPVIFMDKLSLFSQMKNHQFIKQSAPVSIELSLVLSAIWLNK